MGPTISLYIKRNILLFGCLQDETGVYKNLLQETAHRAGLNLPVYRTIRAGPGHVPNFYCTVEIAGMHFTGDPARTKKQAQKNAAIAAWSALRKCEHFADVIMSPYIYISSSDSWIVQPHFVLFSICLLFFFI